VTDTGANGADHAVPEQPPRFSTAEDVNPPLPGDPRYEDYVARRTEWMRWNDRQRAQTPRPEITPAPYYVAGLGRRVTPDEATPEPRPQPPVEAPAPEAVSGDGLDLGPDAEIDGQDEERIWRRTDAANGEYFARVDGDRVRFDHRRKRWLLWAGHWWRLDDTDEVRRLAKEAVRQRYRDALVIHDLKERRRESSFAISSENRSRLEARSGHTPSIWERRSSSARVSTP
jgi:hypothetical protein